MTTKKSNTTIDMTTTNWYNTITRDVTKVPQCITYYEAELEEAKKEVRIFGNLEKASATMPGIVEHRFNQFQQLEAILN